MKIIHVVGARPNFMKAAPVMLSFTKNNTCHQILVHTGQHYDDNMSDIFFQELELPHPDINLEIGSGTHAVQTAQIMIKFERVVAEHRPDIVLVYGDVNSTLAAALVCAKLGIRIGHVEAGLRSFDRSMPEEINRLVTDQVADVLFTPSVDGNENLLREGIDSDKIYLVGNVMIDTLVRLLPKALARWNDGKLCRYTNKDKFCLVTLHRPSNVDEPEMLANIVNTLIDISKHLHIIFPVHPRTEKHLKSLNIKSLSSMFQLIEPLGYLDFLSLMSHAEMVITDSGGVQEETTYLGIPCLTLRHNTERPVTVSIGTNTIVGLDAGRLNIEARRILSGDIKQGNIPHLWDGMAGKRIADVILNQRI